MGYLLSSFVIAILVHELGHCVVAWSLGLRAVPTPAKHTCQTGFHIN